MNRQNTQNTLTKRPASVGLDAMLAMLPHMEAIMSDPELHALGERSKADAGRTLGAISQEAVPLIAGKHRKEMFAIAAAVTGQTAEEVETMPLEDVLTVFQGALGGEVLGFFAFCARLALNC